MDPISLIVAAVVAGASAGIQDTANSAVKDAFEGLKSLIRHRFRGNADAVAELEHTAAAPDADPSHLSAQLLALNAGEDPSLIAAARAVLECVDPEGARAGKYRVAIHGGKGIVVGDESTVTMNFND